MAIGMRLTLAMLITHENASQLIRTQMSGVVSSEGGVVTHVNVSWLTRTTRSGVVSSEGGAVMEKNGHDFAPGMMRNTRPRAIRRTKTSFVTPENGDENIKYINVSQPVSSLSSPGRHDNQPRIMRMKVPVQSHMERSFLSQAPAAAEGLCGFEAPAYSHGSD